MLAVVAILTTTAVLFYGDGAANYANAAESEGGRSLRLSQFRRANSAMKISDLNTTLNVYLTGHKPNSAYYSFQINWLIFCSRIISSTTR